MAQNDVSRMVGFVNVTKTKRYAIKYFAQRLKKHRFILYFPVNNLLAFGLYVF